MAYQMAEQLCKDRLPTSPELAIELCALYAQMHFGDLTTIEDAKFQYILSRFYPAKLLEVIPKSSLRLVSG